MLHRHAAGLALVMASSAWAAPPPAAPPPALTIMTLRLPDLAPAAVDPDEAIARHILAFQPDVVAIYKVVEAGQRAPRRCALAARLQYSCTFITGDPPSRPRRHGSLLLTRHALIEDSITLLHPITPYSAAGMIRLQWHDSAVNIYSADLTDPALSADQRDTQAHDLDAWIRATQDGLPTVIAGKFAMPAQQLVGQLPGFQPLAHDVRTSVALSGQTTEAPHRMGVLYEVRSFTNARQQLVPLDVPPPSAPLTAVLATLIPRPPADASPPGNAP